MREITFREAINEALIEEMARDDNVFVIGEDVIAQGGTFKVTQGIDDRFPGRIWETPISEAGLMGMAVGAAMVGMRPVAEIMFVDFVTCAMDEIVNQAAKVRYLSGDEASVPLVVRLPCGFAKYIAAQHSQTFESWFMNVPGLRLAVPSTPADAKGLLKAAIRCPDPVLFFEYKSLYGDKSGIPEGEHVIPLGKADVKREGEDVTVIAIGSMVPKALEAAVLLEDEGIDAEVIDPRTLRPLDSDTLVASARRTGRVVVCEEGGLFGGVGGEISSIVHERCFGALAAPVARVAARNVPMPFTPALADLVVPGVGDIAEAARLVAAR